MLDTVEVVIFRYGVRLTRKRSMVRIHSGLPFSSTKTDSHFARTRSPLVALQREGPGVILCRAKCLETEDSFQNDGLDLVIELDGDVERFALIKSFFSDGKADDDGAFLLLPGEELGFGRKWRLGTLL